MCSLLSICRRVVPRGLVPVVCFALPFCAGCAGQEAEKGMPPPPVASSRGFEGIDSLREAGSHEETVKVFKDFHYQMHLVNQLIEKSDFESIDQMLPFFRRYRGILLKEESARATEANGYGRHLSAFSRFADEFEAACRNRSFSLLRIAYRRMHDRYNLVKAYRPGGTTD